MPPVANGLCRADIVWSTEAGAEIAVNTIWGFNLAGWGTGPDYPDAQANADSFAHLISDTLASQWTSLNTLISNSAHVMRVDAYALNPSTGKAAAKGSVGFGPTDLKGNSSSAMLPPQIGATLTLWTYPVGGWLPDPKSRKGRIFIPALVISALDSSTGLIADTSMTSLQSAWGGFFALADGSTAPGAGNTWEIGVYSRKDNVLRRVQAVTVSKVPASLKRRANALQHTHSAGFTVPA